MAYRWQVDGQLVVKSLLRGGQLSRSVQPLDRLISVMSQNVEQMPLSRVRELVSGPEGSKVSLGFVRRNMSGRYNPEQAFVTTMTRTSSELQDVQTAIFQVCTLSLVGIRLALLCAMPARRQSETKSRLSVAAQIHTRTVTRGALQTGPVAIAALRRGGR